MRRYCKTHFLAYLVLVLGLYSFEKRISFYLIESNVTFFNYIPITTIIYIYIIFFLLEHFHNAVYQRSNDGASEFSQYCAKANLVATIVNCSHIFS